VVGLLEEPPRGSNNYKSYGVTHLTQLLRIRRLVDLGAPLAEIRAMDPEQQDQEDVLRALDAEAEAAIERLRTVRREIAAQLATSTGPGDSVTAVAATSDASSSTADEDFLVVLSRLLDGETFEAWREMADHAPDDGALGEFSRLAADASLETRERLSEQLAVAVRDLHREEPRLREPGFQRSRPVSFTRKSLRISLAELYNPAQTDVLARTGRILADYSE
jgi:DNA-binding transcriptional MerR regulator